jgi:hypothetical protein
VPVYRANNLKGRSRLLWSKTALTFPFHQVPVDFLQVASGKVMLGSRADSAHGPGILVCVCEIGARTHRRQGDSGPRY